MRDSSLQAIVATIPGVVFQCLNRLMRDSSGYTSDVYGQQYMFQCLNRLMRDSSFVTAWITAVFMEFQCLNRLMRDSSHANRVCSRLIGTCFNASIG